MKNIFLLFVLGVMVSISTHARKNQELMGRESHGGDSLGMEVVSAIEAGMAKFRKLDGGFPLTQNEAQRTLSLLKVIITDDTLEVEHDGNQQISSAINFIQKDGTPVIKVNRAQWKQLTSNMKDALALHEFLSLHGLERTFVYKYSARISKNIVTNELMTAGFICSPKFEPLTQNELSSLFGHYKVDGGIIFLQLFIDYNDHSVKFVHELKSDMLGHFTTSSETQLCYNKKQNRYYLPIAGSLLELERKNQGVVLTHQIDPANDFRYTFDKVER